MRSFDLKHIPPGRRVFLTAALIAILAAACFPARASLLDKLEWKVEKHFGRATIEEMRQAYGFVDDPMLVNYVKKVGMSLATESHRIDIPYEFYIVDTDEVNAFAAPGGFVFVTRGLMEEAETEDELAAVMGHEIGHVAAKHGAKNIKKMPFILAGAAILAGKTDETTQRIAGMAFSLMQFHYSREDEYEADTLGAEYVSAANYDPSGMISFFKKLEREQPTGGLNRLEVAISSHPKTTSRMARIAALPQLQPTPENLLRTADSYFKRFYFIEAKETWEEALAADPENTRAALGIGRSLLEMGDPDGAGEWFTFALRLDPSSEEAFKELARSGGDSPAPAGTFAASSPADADSVKLALGHVNKNLPHLADAIALAGKNRPAIEAPAAEVEKSLIKNLKSYSDVARAFNPDLDPRAKVVDIAAANFNGMMQLIDTLRESAGGIPAVADDAASRSREISYRLEHSPHVTAAAAAAAEDLDTVISEFVLSQDDMQKTLINAADSLREDYNNTHGVMYALSETLEETDADNIGYYSYRLKDRVERTSERLTEVHDDTEKAVRELDLQRLRMRRAVLNFDAALLSPRQEVIFRKMLRRRFGVRPGFFDATAARGLGYADALLLASRSRRDKKKAAEILDAFDPAAGPLDKFLINETTDLASGLLLIGLAQEDIRMLTGRRAAVAPEPEPLPTAARIVNSAGETDDPLLRAAEALDGGRPDEAVSIIHERGKSRKATAMSHLLLGMAGRAQDNPSDAIEDFKYSLKKNWNNTDAHLMLAAAFADLERYEDAANEYTAALKIAPEDPAIKAAAAWNDAMLGKTDAALEALKPLAAAGTDNPRVYLNLGILYYQEGCIGEAVEAFRNALRLDPSRKRLASLVEILETT